MSDLKTTYLGLQLKNPIIVGSSNLVNDTDNLKKMQDAGAAAIVYKSLFEEQIQLERFEFEESLDMYNERNAEMVKIFPNIKHAGPEEHLLKMRKATESVEIPVIASLNALYEVSWEDYARQLAQTGVAALELNFYSTPTNFDKSAKSIEDSILEVVKSVKKAVDIPVSVKLSPFFTNVLSFIASLETAGTDGYVLFNRLFQPEININLEKHSVPWYMSESGDYRLPLRFAGLLHNNVKGSVCATTGIHQGEDVIKLLLAGADAVQVVTALYRYRISHLASMLADIEKWMEEKGYKSVADFRGKLSASVLNDPFVYKRSQYADAILHSHEIMKHTVLR